MTNRTNQLMLSSLLSKSTISALIFACLISFVDAVKAEETKVLENWQQVGTGTLKYLGFRLYTASYYQNEADVASSGEALRIQYHRRIKSDQLLFATEKIWQRMGELSDEQIELYVDRLRSIWPSVTAADELIFKVDNTGAGEFYFNGQLIGKVTDSALSDAFLGIWLSPESPNKQLRNQLLGLTNS